MNVIVLAFDGLEAEIIKEERLENLLQDYHNIIDVSGFKVATPMIWSSFLTGQPPEKHKMYFFTTTGNKYIERIRHALFEHNVNYRTIRRLGKFSKPLLELMGKKPRVPGKEDLNLPTIFDLVEKSLPINVIMYNEWKESEQLKFNHSIVNAVGNSTMTRRIVKEWERIFIKQKEAVLNNLSNHWNLLMTHVYLTDVAGHLYYNNYQKLVQIYMKMDEFAQEVRDSVNASMAVIVVSDHGMRRGMHVPHGFYSLNMEPPVVPKTIMDFYRLIETLLTSKRAPS